jgi:hypothetical protein
MPAAVALALALVAAARAEKKDVKTFPEGTPVVIVAEVTSPPKGMLGEQKMQVGIGAERTVYTLHFEGAALIGLYGRVIDEDGFEDGQWVRAEGRVMKDPRRIRASRIEVISRDEFGMRRSAYFRTGAERGYLTAVTGAAEARAQPVTGPSDPQPPPSELTLVGRISDPAGPLKANRKLQARAGDEQWTLRVADDAAVLGETGGKTSVHDLKKGQWIRATGRQTGDLRMEVTRVETIGTEKAFRRSAFFRPDFSRGYVDRGTSEPRSLEPITWRGEVLAVHADQGYFTMRDERGQERRVPRGTAVIMIRDRAVSWSQVRPGDRVTVYGPMSVLLEEQPPSAEPQR